MRRKNENRFLSIFDRLTRERPDITDPDTAIRDKRVRAGGVVVLSPRALVPARAPIVVEPPLLLRGTVKLGAALTAFEVDVTGRTALDVGACTGGFTIALLSAGARRVHAVEAGFGQLLGSLRQDPRVVNLERTNLGQLTPKLIPDSIDVVTMDLSYLSLARALPYLASLSLSDGADLIALVKPMYELGLSAPPQEAEGVARAVTLATEGAAKAGWIPLGTMRSPILGGRGAVEMLIHARWGGTR